MQSDTVPNSSGSVASPFVEGNYHGQQHRKDNHQSHTEADSKVHPKSGGSEARLSYLVCVVIDNRAID